MRTVYCFTALNLCIIHACMYESVNLSAVIRLRATAGRYAFIHHQYSGLFRFKSAHQENSSVLAQG